jgi:conjugative relaxase-like TrwC/TraI family protein
MLFITPSTNAVAAKDYYTRQLERSDYYMKDAAEMPGQWHGLGAELLGLQGEVKRQDYFALCDNINPRTGANLTRNSQTQRRVLYDFTFDAPKSVSLAYEVGGDGRVLEAFKSAVNDTMGEMEAAMMARVRTKGADEDRLTSNMVWAGFVHRTTRPIDGVPDPQLHCHATVFNATYDTVEDKWKAAQFSNLVRDKGFYQAAFHSRLARNLADIGYGIERDGNSFKLAGIARETAEKFSRRRAIIDAEAERLGTQDHDKRTVLAKRTREKKDANSLSMAELRKVWRERITSDEARSIVAAQSGRDTPTLQAGEAMDYALSHCYERASVVTEKELLKTALIHSVGNATVGQVKGELNRDNVITKSVDGQRYATTREVQREELAVINYARDGKGSYRKLGGIKEPNLDESLSAEQRAAALTILNSRDAVTGLIGRAGTGKTRTTQVIARAIEEGGKKVFAFAPSAKASRGVLRVEGFKDADTVEKLLTDAELQHRIHGQVLWIDEAGLLSTPDLKRIFDLAKRQEARVVLSGDSAQHSSVRRGDALRILQRYDAMQCAQLSEVRRQTNKDYRDAVTFISEGDRLAKDGRTMLEHGIEALDKMGAIVEVEGDARYRHLAADYVATTSDIKKDGEYGTALVVAPTHSEGAKVTDAIREGLKKAERITGKEHEFTSLASLNLTEAQRGDYANYRPGDVVQFVQNARGYKRGERMTVKQADAGGVMVERENGRTEKLALQQANRFQLYEAKQLELAKGDRLRITQNGFTAETRRGGKLAKSRLDNGDIYQVSGFTKEGDIQLSNGFVVPKSYGGMTHGYVVTSHASQGTTVDKVLIALGTESLAAANRQTLYVAFSRGREAARLYTDDKATVLEAVKTDAKRLSATELMEGIAPVKRSSGIGRLIHTQKIQRAYSAVRERMTGWVPPQQREVGLGR